MRILFTGASSFTGSWFAAALADAGHAIVATFRGDAESYRDLRAARLKSLAGRVEPVWTVEFGDDKFQEIAATRSFDLFCHHAAEMTDYRSWDFDPLRATAANTRGARSLVERLAKRGCRGVVFTGSVFEPFEGIGDAQERAFNPYGLSKHFSFEVFRLEAERVGLPLGKFVIPNPFGPREELRFTSFLAREWIAGRVPRVATPAYVRDNIHVSALARAYVGYCGSFDGADARRRATPSGYIEDQGAFAHRVAREMSPRIDRPCAVDLAEQTAFPEPLVRVNDHPAQIGDPAWSESAAWDDLAAYYRATFTDMS